MWQVWFFHFPVFIVTSCVAMPIGLYMARVFDGHFARRGGFDGSNRGWTPGRRTGGSMRLPSWLLTSWRSWSGSWSLTLKPDSAAEP